MRLFVICILLFVTIRVKAQEIPLSDSLIAYEKLIFHSSDEYELNTYVLRKADFLKRNNNIPYAYSTYVRVNESVFTDSIKAEVYFQRALCAYLLSNYTECDLHLSKMKYLLSDSSYYNRKMWLSVLSLNEQYKWAEAKETLKIFISANGISLNVDSAYTFISRVKLKNEKTAEALSTFLPGMGQLYIGEFKHGVLNATILLACLTWGTLNVINGYYLTGVFTGYFIGYSFYVGGIRYASDGVKRANARITERYNGPLRNLILGSDLPQ